MVGEPDRVKDKGLNIIEITSGWYCQVVRTFHEEGGSLEVQVGDFRVDRLVGKSQFSWTRVYLRLNLPRLQGRLGQ